MQLNEQLKDQESILRMKEKKVNRQKNKNKNIAISNINSINMKSDDRSSMMSNAAS